MIVQTRAETFGAWVRVDDTTLIAVDRERASKLGVQDESLWNQSSEYPARLVAPLELHIAVTSQCPVQCAGCYLDAKPEGLHVHESDLEQTLIAAAQAKVFTVAFGGGEPLMLPNIGRLAERARELGLVPVMTTSGIGMTQTKAKSLRAFAQVNVSHDGVLGGYSAVREVEGDAWAERAIRRLVEANIRVGVNTVLTRPSFGECGEILEATYHHAARLGASEIQLLRYKPAGRAASLTYFDRRLTPAQIEHVSHVIQRMVQAKKMSVRIDCAMVPLLSKYVSKAHDLIALGVMGCEAGNALGSVRTDRTIAPCSFASSTQIDAQEITNAWNENDTFAPWHNFANNPPEPCASCSIRSVCRGGCKIVAGYVTTNAFAPDPECPLVLAFSTQPS